MIFNTPPHKKSIKNKIILLALLFLVVGNVSAFAKVWVFDMYVVREDDQSEGFKDSKEYFPITYGRWGGLEIPYTGEVKLGVDGTKSENHEEWMDDTSWWWHWKKFHYVSWDDYGKKT